MYYYNVGCFTYEESDYYQLLHKQKFSDAEFESLVLDVAPEAVERARNRYPGEPLALKSLTISECLEELADVLWERHGFERLQFTTEWIVQGWNTLSEPTWLTDHGSVEASERMQRLSAAIKASDIPS